jgi:SRSO17 transposase
MYFKNSTFDDEKMLNIYQQQLAALIGEEDGMLNVDGSDFPKKGSHSVGVARQHCGILGKTENCQAGVFVGYSSTKGYGLVDRRLYMPESWFSESYDGLRKQCAVPDDLTFRTKNQLASEMLQAAAASGTFPFRWSVATRPSAVIGLFWNPYRRAATISPMYVPMNWCFPVCQR